MGGWPRLMQLCCRFLGHDWHPHFDYLLDGAYLQVMCYRCGANYRLAVGPGQWSYSRQDGNGPTRLGGTYRCDHCGRYPLYMEELQLHATQDSAMVTTNEDNGAQHA